MDHKTATAALDRLVQLGLIADSGHRAGRTKQIKVYRLALESSPETEAFQKRKPSNNGRHPDLLREAPQKRGTDTVKEPNPQETSSPSGKRTRRASPHPMPADFVPRLTKAVEALVANWPDGALEAEVEGCRDWHAARGKLACDWQAAFRTWLRKAETFRQRAAGGKPANGFDAALRDAENRLAPRARFERASGWEPQPGYEGFEPASLDDWPHGPILDEQGRRVG